MNTGEKSSCQRRRPPKAPRNQLHYKESKRKPHRIWLKVSVCWLGPVRCALFGLKIRRRPLWPGNPLAAPSPVRPASLIPNPGCQTAPKPGSRQDRFSTKYSQAKKDPLLQLANRERAVLENLKPRLPQARRTSAHSLPYPACCNQRAGILKSYFINSYLS